MPPWSDTETKMGCCVMSNPGGNCAVVVPFNVFVTLKCVPLMPALLSMLMPMALSE